jgi:hypothetical protein
VYRRLSGEMGGTVRAGDYTFSYGKEIKITNWEQNFVVHHRIVQQLRE